VTGDEWAPMRAETINYLRTVHPDPFTQAAIYRVWRNAPGLLREDVKRALDRTQGKVPTEPEATP
jgi:hypothetical protein